MGEGELHGIEIYFRSTELLVTFLVIVLGLAFGQLKIKGIGFGSSGVLIVAMVAGYLYEFEPVMILQDLGIVLFLLAVGLEAGPGFFRSFREHGRRYIANVIVLLAIAGINTIIIIGLAGVPIGVGLGIFAGSFTSSPALISALQFSPEEEVIFGYGVAYPFGLIGVILFINLAVKFLKSRMDAESSARTSLVTAVHRLNHRRWNGKLIREIEAFRENEVVVSGIRRDMALLPASGKTSLVEGDLLRLEGKAEDVERVGKEIGPPVDETFGEHSDLDTRSIAVENLAAINRSLADLGIRLRFNASITRIIRQDVEFVPREDLALSYGDTVVAVGTPYQLDQLEIFLGHRKHSVRRRVDIGSLAATLFLAFAIGGVIIPIPELGPFSLGLAGGALVSGLLFGHYGRIGNFIGRFPHSATMVLKELGLALFFVQVGFDTGQSFVNTLNLDAIWYALYAVLLAVIPMFGSFLFGHYVLKMQISEAFGVVCGGMTFTPGLDIIHQVDSSEKPVVAYSSVYPVALILVILLVQLMFLALVAIRGI